MSNGHFVHTCSSATANDDCDGWWHVHRRLALAPRYHVLSRMKSWRQRAPSKSHTHNAEGDLVECGNFVLVCNAIDDEQRQQRQMVGVNGQGGDATIRAAQFYGNKNMLHIRCVLICVRSCRVWLTGVVEIYYTHRFPFYLCDYCTRCAADVWGFVFLSSSDAFNRCLVCVNTLYSRAITIIRQCWIHSTVWSSSLSFINIASCRGFSDQRSACIEMKMEFIRT